MTNVELCPPRWADTRTTAQHINSSESFLNNLRVSGDGIPFVKMGRKVLYDLNEVDDWLSRRRRLSTSDGIGGAK